FRRDRRGMDIDVGVNGSKLTGQPQGDRLLQLCHRASSDWSCQRAAGRLYRLDSTGSVPGKPEIDSEGMLQGLRIAGQHALVLVEQKPQRMAVQGKPVANNLQAVRHWSIVAVQQEEAAPDSSHPASGK